MISKKELIDMLSQYRLAHIDADILARKIEDLRDRKTSATFMQEEGSRSTAPKDMSDYIVLLEALEEQLQAKLHDELKKLRTVQNLIWQMPQSTKRTLLALRYLDGLSWLEVARRLGYSTRNVFRLHDAALDECRRFMSPDFAL